MWIWHRLSISKKLYAVVGIMALLLVGELLALGFAMDKLSAVRAFVGGEGLWSKAQKDAVFSIQRFALTESESDYQDFARHLAVPDGDHQARIELMKPDPDMNVIRQGFLKGQIHPDDIDSTVRLIRRFHWVSYLSRALATWSEGDELIQELKQAGKEYHDLVRRPDTTPREMRASLVKIRDLNTKLTVLESSFSQVLGEGSRWMERLVLALLSLAVLTVESFGLTTTFLTIRTISRGLQEIAGAATRAGQGDFSHPIPIHSEDEIGLAANAINQMKKSLEQTVRTRTSDLQRLSEEARAAVRSRDEFISVASHELKTPLTALGLQLQVLSKMTNANSKASPERIGELVKSCAKQSARLSHLVEDLMDLTRIRLGRIELNHENCDLSSLCQEISEELRLNAERSGSRIEVNAASPIVAEIDPGRIRQVITNLISNAIKYGQGSPILVSAESKDGVGILRVQDQGPGISPEQQDLIFEPFERGKADQKIKGLGLGLYVTRQIVEAHQGQIQVTSRPGEGATFEIKLPLVRS